MLLVAQKYGDPMIGHRCRRVDRQGDLLRFDENRRNILQRNRDFFRLFDDQLFSLYTEPRGFSVTMIFPCGQRGE